MPKKKAAAIGRKRKGETKDAALLEAKRRKEAEAEAAAKEEPCSVCPRGGGGAPTSQERETVR